MQRFFTTHTITVRVENFEGGKFRAIQDFAFLENFAGITSTCIIFVSSATHEKREIKKPRNFLPVR